jgi:DNA segregation ATPase FtsK/SpoIIIE, S-DNA-T family
MRLNPFKRARRRGRKPYAGWLRPETKQAAIGVLLILFSIIVILSFVNQAGKAGAATLSGLRWVFGYPSYVTPLLFIYIGWRLVRPNREPLDKWRIVGITLLVVGVLGSFHLIGVSPDVALQVAYEGRGGGFLGFMLSYPLSAAISGIASTLIFIAAVLIGGIMTFNITPADIAKLFTRLSPEREAMEDSDEQEDEDDESVEDQPRFRIARMGAGAPTDPEQMPLKASAEQDQADLKRRQVKAANRKYNPPPLELLESSSRQGEGGNVEGNKKIIANTLSNFNISVEVGKANVGPTVTQYTLRPEEGIRLSQITALHNDLSRALKAHPVRIEAPIPNTDLVGIEIPNKEVALVRLRDMLASKEMRRSESPLSFTLGRDVSGKTFIADLDRMPHLLIAGATNSGKSVSIHSLLMSLLYRNSPALLRLILIDPKRVELTAYNNIPHLRNDPVIVDTAKALNALKWALSEMDRRYKMLEGSGSRNLFSFNINNPEQAQPFIVIVIDELADLMAKHAREVEGPVVRLAQLARAVGIHLVLATQRPSVNVITGLIKANIPARIAFKVASQVDSRTILDIAGAEKLVGTGDMLYLSADIAKPRRLQGGFVSEEEVHRVVKYIVENNPSENYTAENESITTAERESSGSTHDGGDDPLFAEAKRLALESGKVSASLLQRRLRVGYARGARLLDMLEEQGIIGQAEGNKPREIIMSEERRPDTSALRHLDTPSSTPENNQSHPTDDSSW